MSSSTILSTLAPTLSSPTILVFLVLASALIYSNVRSYLRLRHIPGPWLAGWTNLPRLLWVMGGKAHDVHIALHRKYGSVVRFGPNMISVQDPAEIGNIYGISRKFQKV